MALGLGWLLREKHNVARIAAASLTGSIAFFLISNLATFVQYDIYPHTWSGLATCYAMGVPFFRNSVAGDLLYALAMFATPAMVSLLHQSRGKNSIAA